MKTKIIILSLIIIGVISSIFMFSIEDNSTIRIVNGGQEQIIDKDFIYNHPDSTNFPSVVRSSGEKPVETEYMGVELEDILKSLNIDTSKVEKVTLNATDGYRVIIGIEEVNDSNNVYLIFKRDGKYLKPKKQNGNGPFQLVIRRDPFSQRWIKHVDEIILE